MKFGQEDVKMNGSGDGKITENGGASNNANVSNVSLINTTSGSVGMVNDQSSSDQTNSSLEFKFTPYT